MICLKLSSSCSKLVLFSSFIFSDPLVDHSSGLQSRGGSSLWSATAPERIMNVNFSISLELMNLLDQRKSESYLALDLKWKNGQFGYNNEFRLRGPNFSGKLESGLYLESFVQILEHSTFRPKIGPLSRNPTLVKMV